MSRGKTKAAGRSPANRFRIVGGRWRGRRLTFVPRPALRPTPDRVRETLFNWLAPVVSGARCLDLFAGSGALGLEALSRGAGSAVFVDNDALVCDRIRLHLETLGCGAGEVVQTDSLAFVRGGTVPFDIVLIDPPYASGVTAELCKLLISGGCLSPVARVYIEYPRGQQPDVGADFATLRLARAGRVEFALLTIL